MVKDLSDKDRRALEQVLRLAAQGVAIPQHHGGVGIKEGLHESGFHSFSQEVATNSRLAGGEPCVKLMER